ncbi:MAG: hypothetical protein ACOYIF_08710 [Acetivibrionales bacterium]|jgi:hypothetical protein
MVGIIIKNREIRALPTYKCVTIIEIGTRDYLKDIAEIVKAAVSRNTERCVNRVFGKNTFTMSKNRIKESGRDGNKGNFVKKGMEIVDIVTQGWKFGSYDEKISKKGYTKGNGMIKIR